MDSCYICGEHLHKFMTTPFLEMPDGKFEQCCEKCADKEFPEWDDDDDSSGDRLMDWISVEDRLPKEGQTVIFYNGMIGTGWYQKSVFPGESSRPGWNLDLSEYYLELCDVCEVTHWMPLPKPPSSKENES